MERRHLKLSLSAQARQERNDVIGGQPIAGVAPGEDIDDLQIQLNKLHSENLQEQLLALQFFAEYLEDEMIPKELFLSFRDTIMGFFGLISNLTEMHVDNVLIILGEIVEYFEDEYDFVSLFQRVWAILPNDEAFNVCAKMLKSNIPLSMQFISNGDFTGQLFAFLQNENPDLRNSGLLLVSSLANNGDNVSLMEPLFEIVCQMAGSNEETDENVIMSLFVLKLFAKTDSGINFLSEVNLMFIISNVLSRPNSTKTALDFLLQIGYTSTKCLSFFVKADVCGFIFSSIDSIDPNIALVAIRICFCISNDGENGVQFLMESEVLPKLIAQSEKGNKLWKPALSTLCACIYNGSSQVIAALLGSGLLQIIADNICNGSQSLLNDLLRALQTVIAEYNLQNNTDGITELSQSEQLVDELWSLSEEMEGKSEGAIALHIYKLLTGEE